MTDANTPTEQGKDPEVITPEIVAKPNFLPIPSPGKEVEGWQWEELPTARTRTQKKALSDQLTERLGVAGSLARRSLAEIADLLYVAQETKAHQGEGLSFYDWAAARGYPTSTAKRLVADARMRRGLPPATRGRQITTGGERPTTESGRPKVGRRETGRPTPEPDQSEIAKLQAKNQRLIEANEKYLGQIADLERQLAQAQDTIAKQAKAIEALQGRNGSRIPTPSKPDDWDPFEGLDPTSPNTR